MSKFTYIDLFAGCGGLSEGFSQSGLFEGIAHVEWELPMVETLRQRLVDTWNYSVKEATTSVIHFDIQKTSELIQGAWSEETKSVYGNTNAKSIQDVGLDGIIGGRVVDVVIGGPPCQAYSIAGRAQDKNSMKDDYRNYLFESFIKVVENFQPKLFVFENVPGILTAKPGDELVIERIYKAFAEIGYQIKSPEKLKEAMYTATDFGVPQKRNRIIIVGVRNDLNWDLEQVYVEVDKQKQHIVTTVFDAIGTLPKFIPLSTPKKINKKNVSHVQDESVEEIPLHISRYHNARDVSIFREWIQENFNTLSTQEKIDFYYAKTGKKSNHAKYRNLEWNQPSPTIVAHLHKDGLMFIHPDGEQARSITVREAALLQSFPLDYRFLGGTGYCYKMIGNAVPPLMAEKIAIGLGRFLNEKKSQSSNIVKQRASSKNDDYQIALPSEPTKRMNILVACEESQAVTMELRALGHNAYSCDLLKCSGGHPEWHFNVDVFEIIKNNGGALQNGKEAFVLKWDMMIAHPPCTFLAVSGAQWYYHPEDKHLPTDQRRPHPRFPNRAQDKEDAIAFFKALWETDIPRIAIENPVGVMSSHIGKATQIVQPWMFGDEATKTTCLWIKNLPLLEPTDIVGKGEMLKFPSGKSMAKWYADALVKAKTPEERRNLRSKTFKGMAKAMADQWAGLITDVEG